MFSEGERNIAPFRNSGSILNGSFIAAKNTSHFLPALTVKFIIGEMKMFRIIQCFPCRNTQLDFLAARILFSHIMKVICRHQSQSIFFCQVCQYRPYAGFFRQSVILQFNKIIIPAECINIKLYNFVDLIHIAGQNGLWKLSAHAGRQRNQPLMILPEQVMISPGLIMKSFRPCPGTDFYQIVISLIIFCQQNQMIQFFSSRRHLETAVLSNIYFTANNGFDSLLFAFIVQIHSAIH